MAQFRRAGCFTGLRYGITARGGDKFALHGVGTPPSRERNAPPMTNHQGMANDETRMTKRSILRHSEYGIRHSFVIGGSFVIDSMLSLYDPVERRSGLSGPGVRAAGQRWSAPDLRRLAR